MLPRVACLPFRVLVRKVIAAHPSPGCDFILMPSRYEPCGLPQTHGRRFKKGLLCSTRNLCEGSESRIKWNRICPKKFGGRCKTSVCRSMLNEYVNIEALGAFYQSSIRSFSWLRMTAATYGAVVIATATGGLKDSVNGSLH